MSRLAISLLGPLRVTLDREPVIHFRTDMARALLAYLVLSAQAPCRRQRLAGLVWPDQSDATALRNLRVTLDRLRKAIADREADPPFLKITRKSIQFNADSDYWLDAEVFTDLLAACQEHRHRRLEACRSCMKRLQQAVELYAGDFMAGFSVPSASLEQWLEIQRERFRRQAMEALHHLATYFERRQEYGQAEYYAQRQLELEPWRESAHRQLMRALALSGQRGAALAQYEVCRGILREELNIEPEEWTVTLYERIRDGGDLGSLSVIPPHNLPALLTPFVGRESELAEVEDYLQAPACRLLTLVGPGGIGKTTLALEAGAQQLGSFDDGVYVVSLAAVQSADTLVPTIAQALGFSFHADAGGGSEADPRRQLLSYLRQRDMLLILDNFEHLLDGVDLIVDILRTAPDVKIMTTSRARLNAQGEHVFRVGGMDHPESAATAVSRDPGEYSAVTLFLLNARRARRDLELTADDLAQVARICGLVRGMPLAIVLAASWTEILSPSEVAREIERTIDFLKADLRDLPERQRSIRAVFDHSWNLLTRQEQAVFQALSVFRGGFTGEAAQQVAGASLDELMALAHKSLIHRTPSGRYGIHELLRQYAVEKLTLSPDTEASARERQSAYYVASLQRWGADLRGPSQAEAMARLTAEAENARAAWDWAVEQADTGRIAQAMEGLVRFYERRGRYLEGEAACRLAAEKLSGMVEELPGEGRRTLARALGWQGLFNQLMGRIDVIPQLLQQGLSLLGDSRWAEQDIRAERAFLLQQLGQGTRQSDREETKRCWEESLDLYRGLGDRWAEASLLSDLGHLYLDVGERDRAERAWKESLDLRRSLGDQRGIAQVLLNLANDAHRQGWSEQSECLVQEAIGLLRNVGDRLGTANGRHALAQSFLLQGRFAEAHELLEDVLTEMQDLGSRRYAATTNAVLAWAKVNLGLYEEACLLYEVSLEQWEEVADRRGVGAALARLGHIAVGQGAYAEAQQFLQEGIAIFREVQQPDALAQAIIGLGHAERGLGRAARAWQYLADGVRIASEIGVFWAQLTSLRLMALLLVDRGEVERAVELYALAVRYPYATNSRHWEDVAGKHVAAAAATLPPQVVEAAEARGRARDLEATAAELLRELEAIPDSR